MPAKPDWPRYKSHKVVQATKIVAIDRDADDRKVLWIDKGDGNHQHFETSVEQMAERAEVGDYAIWYADDFRSVSPGGVFENEYTIIP